MPDFLRWIIAGATSVVVAGLVFLLATVGIVVAFFVFLVLFVVFGLAMRRARKNVQYGEDGSRFIIYTNIPGAGTGNADRVRRDDPDTYELSRRNFFGTRAELAGRVPFFGIHHAKGQHPAAPPILGLFSYSPRIVKEMRLRGMSTSSTVTSTS